MPKRCVIRNVKIDDVRPESVVGRDILNPQGHLILAKGARLTPDIIDRLERLGISSISIKVEEEVAELDPKALEKKCKGWTY
jgi:hypothetical protein